MDNPQRDQKQIDTFLQHFAVVGDTLIKINQRWLDVLLKFRHAETEQVKDEQSLRIGVSQTHYSLLQKYSIESINTLFN